MAHFLGVVSEQRQDAGQSCLVNVGSLLKQQCSNSRAAKPMQQDPCSKTRTETSGQQDPCSKTLTATAGGNSRRVASSHVTKTALLKRLPLCPEQSFAAVVSRLLPSFSPHHATLHPPNTPSSTHLLLHSTPSSHPI